MSIKAPFYRYDDIRRYAEAFLAEYHPQRTTPVPIEAIIEIKLCMDIVPIPGLQDGFDIVAYLTHDLLEICVDERIYDKFAQSLSI